MALGRPEYWIQKLGVSATFAEFCVDMAVWANQLGKSFKAMIAELVPVALPVLGLVLVVFFGVKFIKKVMR